MLEHSRCWGKALCALAREIAVSGHLSSRADRRTRDRVPPARHTRASSSSGTVGRRNKGQHFRLHCGASNRSMRSRGGTIMRLWIPHTNYSASRTSPRHGFRAAGVSLIRERLAPDPRPASEASSTMSTPHGPITEPSTRPWHL
jgi:hypothetical protein